MSGILLIWPPLFDKKDRIVNEAGYPDIGLGYLATALRREGFEVDILDWAKDDLRFESFADIIRRKHYDVIGFKTFSYNMGTVKRYAGIVKNVDPSTVVIVGGPHPSGDPEGTLQFAEEFDYGFKGEGEIGLPKFMTMLSRDRSVPVSEVPGLIWRDDGAVVANPPKFVENLDELGFPSWDLIDPRRYHQIAFGIYKRGYYTANIMATRGCPFRCTYCAADTVSGSKIRRRSVDHIMEEILFLHSKYDVRGLLFLDDNFTFDISFAKQVLERICSEDLDLILRIYNLRIDTLDEEVIKLMERAGCSEIGLGFEFGSQRILDAVKKKTSLDTMVEKVDMIRRASDKMVIKANFIIGHHTEEAEDIKSTIRLARRLKIDKAAFSIFTPVPGSQDYETMKQKNLLTPSDETNWRIYRYVDGTWTPNPRVGNTKNWLRWAMLSFYLRPRIILARLRELKSRGQMLYLYEIARGYLFGK